MKDNRIIKIFFCIIFIFVLVGCGKTNIVVEQQSKIPEVEIENIENEFQVVVLEEPINEDKQIYSLLLTIMSASEDSSYLAYNSDGKEYKLLLADTFPEEDKVNLSKMEVVEVTSYDEKGQKDGEKTILVIETAILAEETQETIELKNKAFKWFNGFSVDTTITGNLYAKQAVNVRNGPSTDYEKLGSLTFAEEVIVTGMADTGWYQIMYLDDIGYVSNNYIVAEKPTATVNSLSKSNTTENNSNVVNSASSNGDEFYAVYSETEMDEALNNGDMQTFFEMLNANAAASILDGTENPSGQTESAVTQKTVSLSTEFVNYLNMKRADQGLEVLSWSDSMGETALKRAEEIVSDFSHNGSRNCSAENIAKTSNASVAEWYDSFYNSTIHRYAMLNKSYKTTAVAVCQVGNTHYIVVLFGY